MTCVDWAKKLARAKRRRILAERRIKRICTNKFRGVLCFLQCTYVGVDGVPYSCTSGNLWGTYGSIQPLILRTSLKIGQCRRRLVRRKKMLRKRSFAPQNAGARSDGEKIHFVFSQPGTSACGNQDLRKLSCGSSAVPNHWFAGKMVAPTPSYRATTPSTHVNVSLIDSIASNSCADDFRKPYDIWATEKCNDVWGTDGYTKYGFRPHGKIAQGRNRLERRKKMLWKRMEYLGWATHHNPRSVCRPSSSGVNSIYERSLINGHCPSESVGPNIVACNIETFDSR